MSTPKRGSAWRGSLMADLWSHPKVAALTPKEMPDALALWMLAHSWATYQRTDGEVPERVPRMLTGWSPPRSRRAAGALVRVGLWEVIAGGWTFHDWSDHNLTAGERDAWSRAGELGGAARAASASRGAGG